MTSSLKSCQAHLHLAEQVAHVERSQVETREFVAEQHRLIVARAGQHVEAAQSHAAELVTLVATVIAAMGTLVAAAPVLARWLGQG